MEHTQFKAHICTTMYKGICYMKGDWYYQTNRFLQCERQQFDIYKFVHVCKNVLDI